jgi:Spy/CpxP family protein refolding chaperone
MKKNIIIFGVLITFMLIAALPGQALQYWQQDMWPNSGMNLTSEQIQKIQELTLEFQKDILPMENELENLYMQVESQSYSSTGQAKLDAVYQRIDNLELALEKKYMEHDNKIRSLLTDEQKVLFDQWGGLGYGLGSLGMGMAPGLGMQRGYAGYGQGLGRSYLGYGRGLGRGYAGYGRGYAGYGRGYAGLGRGYAGYGRGYAGYGRGLARGYMGYGRGYANYGRGYMGYGRGFAPGLGQAGWGRGWGRGLGMGRGYWCPWYRQGRLSMMRNWWW